MNGGPPAGGAGGSAGTARVLGGMPALRALRHAPVLVDDVGSLPTLRAAWVASPDGAGDAAGEELTRWTRAWLVVWQGALHAAGVIGAEPPWAVAVALDDVPTLKGDPDRGRRDAALALLERAGLLTRDHDGTRATLAESLFVEHRAGLEVDWAAACRTAGREPAALLVLRALGELIAPLDTLTPVSLRELAARTGYGEKQVRVALRRLVEAGALHAVEAPGQPARYRLSDTCLGRGAAAAFPAATPLSAVEPPSPGRWTPLDQPTPREPRAATPAVQPPALRLTLNGVTVALAAGLTAQVGIDTDGVPHLTVAPPVTTER